jgi:pentatricopeptide repeat protein
MLNWIAENYDGTILSLKKFLESPEQKPERTQNARSILVFVYAKQKNFDEALKYLADMKLPGRRRRSIAGG